MPKTQVRGVGFEGLAHGLKERQLDMCLSFEKQVAHVKSMSDVRTRNDQASCVGSIVGV